MTNPTCTVQELTLSNRVRAVRMTNPFMQVDVLPDKGADICSIVHRATNVEVMWQSPLGLRRLDAGWSSPQSEVAWLEHYEGGWQELLPHTGAPEVYKGVELSFHGESTLLPWRYEILEEAGDVIAVDFSVNLYRSPFRLLRRMTMDAQSSCMKLVERVTNLAGETMDFVWGHHPAYGAPFISEHARIHTNAQTLYTDPNYDHEFCVVVQGETTAWPYAKGKNGGNVDKRIVTPASQPNFFMGYLSNFAGDPWYAVTNAALKVGAGVAWTPNAFRHLWLWQELNASAGFPFYKRSYTVALEPHSSYPHGLVNIMNTTKTHHTLEAGGSLDAALTFALFDVHEEKEIRRIGLDGEIAF